MRRADASQAPRDDFAAFRHELREQTHVFVIDGLNLLRAKLADFLATEVLAPCAASALSPSAAGPGRTSFSSIRTIPAK
jgi:hypothetical protein